ncbi:hypothetical protein L6164_031794 [Bauhinia variegata]|uniref:Uncharacterized protein n=1 Tax=Bauhinia variegata TaxID=167791 RepID=A0ACB9KLK3_BAUVA|nr:hypothetical protein L6164_031794 [Bauhinia variegata]
MASANYTNHFVFLFQAIFSIFLFFQSSNAATVDVLSFGAKPDGRSDSTVPFLRAWSTACNSIQPATIYIPRGSFLLKQVTFNGPCKKRINFQMDGTLVASSNYWSLGNSGHWILFRKVDRLTIYGGTINAQAKGYWGCRRAGRSCPAGARSITFSWSNNVVVRGLTSLNSQKIHIAVDHCNNVLIQDVHIRAPSGSPNTDGINVQFSKGVTVSHCTIMTGDDCISISQGSTNMWIERVACGPGHGISIGSLGTYVNEAGVQNVTVTNSVFTKTLNGVRIKSWAQPSNGFARDIVFRNLIMNNVYNPIIIDQRYCPGDRGCPRRSSGVKISGVTYDQIRGTSLSPVAINFDCSPSNPCRTIKLKDTKLTYVKGAATSSCRYATGSNNGAVVPRSCLSE